MNLFNLFAKISLDDKEYTKKIDLASKSAVRFSDKLKTGFKQVGKAALAVGSALAVVAGATYKAAMIAVNFGDNIDKQSQKLNMSNEMYQKWSLALRMAGTDISQMQMGMKSLTDVIDNASKGQTEALITLDKLGIGYEDFAKMSPEEIFYAVVKSLQGMEAGAEKTQFAIDLFGRSGQELLPILNQEEGSIEDLFNQMEDLGLIMDDTAVKKSAKLSDEMEILKTRFTLAKVGLAEDLMPALETGIDLFETFADQISTGTFWQDQGEMWKFVGDEMWKGITGIYDDISNWVGGLFENIGKFMIEGIWGGFKSKLSQVGENIGNGLQWLVGKAKEKIDSHSPSKLTANEVGKPFAQGIAVGYDKEMPKVNSDIIKSTKTEDLVNGIVGGLRIPQGNSVGGGVTKIYIGDREIKEFVVKTVDNNLKSNGLKPQRIANAY